MIVRGNIDIVIDRLKATVIKQPSLLIIKLFISILGGTTAHTGVRKHAYYILGYFHNPLHVAFFK